MRSLGDFHAADDTAGGDMEELSVSLSGSARLISALGGAGVAFPSGVGLFIDLGSQEVMSCVHLQVLDGFGNPSYDFSTVAFFVDLFSTILI